MFIAQKRLVAAAVSVGADDADAAEADDAAVEVAAVDDGITDESASAVFDF